MSHVVNEACVNCKYGDCVEVCPVNCFYEGGDQVYINPEECIDCEACVSECPVNAITSDSEASASFIDKNKTFAFSEETRRTAKGDVTHGPNYKA
jgi:ferredoxin